MLVISVLSFFKSQFLINVLCLFLVVLVFQFLWFEICEHGGFVFKTFFFF